MNPICRFAGADFLLAVATVFVLGGCGESTPTPPVVQEVVKPTPEQELAALMKKAEAGDAEAQYQLGWTYSTGRGAQKNLILAEEWLQKSAAQGHTEAQYQLGCIQYFGETLTKEAEMDLQWWRYEPKHVEKALEWWKLAAEKDHAASQHSLAVIYELGMGVPKDLSKALDLRQKAAERGNASAQSSLGYLYLNGNGVAKDATKAVELYRKAAEQGHSGAQSNLGTLYLQGEGVPKNSAIAVKWFQKSAALGDEGGQFNLAHMFAVGDAIGRDLVLAYAWLNIGAANGKVLGITEEARRLRNRIEGQLSIRQVTEGQRLASDWKKGELLKREVGGEVDTGDTRSGAALTKRGTGTLFVVSKAGHAITNQHVIQGCAELRIEGREGVVKKVTEDVVNDLALVQIPGEGKPTAVFAADPAKLRQGEDIVVFGFPLNAVLSSGGNLTPGVVSAITGLGNNTNQIQITAPIQPGSSGNPVLNKKGEVVGVVSMKLSDAKMAKATGQIGQNVNFAVGGQTLKTFLDTHKVEYRSGGFLSFEKSTADLADEARKWTLVVECWK